MLLNEPDLKDGVVQSVEMMAGYYRTKTVSCIRNGEDLLYWDKHSIWTWTGDYYLNITPDSFYIETRDRGDPKWFSLYISNNRNRLLIKLNGKKIYTPSYEIKKPSRSMKIKLFVSKMLGEIR